MIRMIRIAIARRRYVLAKRRYRADPSFMNFEAQRILGNRWFRLAFPEAIQPAW